MVRMMSQQPKSRLKESFVQYRARVVQTSYLLDTEDIHHIVIDQEKAQDLCETTRIMAPHGNFKIAIYSARALCKLRLSHGNS